MVGIKVKRPVIVSIMCITGLIMVVFSFIYAFSPTVKKIGEFYPALYSLVICLEFIACIGIWYMKKWGVHLFIIALSGKETLLLLMNDFNNTGAGFMFSMLFLVLSITILIVMLFYYKRMDINL
jgi:hypothetical protein